MAREYSSLPNVSEFYKEIAVIDPGMIFVVHGGSTAFGYNTHTSDLDALVATDNPGWYSSGEFPEIYCQTHIRHGFTPDFLFPGEIVTPEQLKDAIAGRGFIVKECSLEFPNYHNDAEWLKHPDSWYAPWLTITAMSRFICGNQSTYEEFRINSWETLVKFCLTKFNEQRKETCNPKNIIELLASMQNLWHNRSSLRLELFEVTKPSMLVAINKLYDQEFLTHTAYGEFIINPSKVADWRNQLIRNLMLGKLQHCDTSEAINTNNRRSDKTSNIFPRMNPDNV